MEQPSCDQQASQRIDAANALLFAEAPGDWYSAVHALHVQYASITGICAYPSGHLPVILPSGKALSVDAAAHCLLEPKRTAFFLRGIWEALAELRKSVNDRPLRVLYAGCGPYATLITPLLHLFESDSLCVELLDINEQSLVAVQKLWQELHFTRFAKKIILADAVSFVPENSHGIDLLISETLNTALNSEPFVSIVENLVPRLRRDARFIPEKVTVNVLLAGPGGKSTLLGEVGCVGRNWPVAPQATSFVLPDTSWLFDRMWLQTEVQVTDKLVLSNMDTSLTMRRRVKLDHLMPGQKVSFYYEKGMPPGFRYSRQ